MIRRFSGVALVAAALLAPLAGCHRVRPDMAVRPVLDISISPEILAPGAAVSVAVKPVPAVAMRSVSGTVAVMGAPVMPFSYDAARELWVFKTVIPTMVAIPAGAYTVKAWGLSAQGDKIEGSRQIRIQ